MDWGWQEFFAYLGFGMSLGAGFFYPLAVGKLIYTAFRHVD